MLQAMGWQRVGHDSVTKQEPPTVTLWVLEAIFHCWHKITVTTIATATITIIYIYEEPDTALIPSTQLTNALLNLMCCWTCPLDPVICTMDLSAPHYIFPSNISSSGMQAPPVSLHISAPYIPLPSYCLMGTCLIRVPPISLAGHGLCPHQQPRTAPDHALQTPAPSPRSPGLDAQTHTHIFDVLLPHPAMALPSSAESGYQAPGSLSSLT